QAPANVDELLDHAEQLIFGIQERKVKQAFAKLSEILVESIKTIERLYEQKQAVTGVPTGFADLDALTAGLQPSDLIIVAGRPSMGKTAFCLNIAEHAALRSDVGVAIFSLEMAKEQLAMRMLCSEARVDLARVRTGHLSDREFPKLAMAAGRLGDAPIYIDDTPALSVLELRAKARRLKRDAASKLGLVIVDYIQLMRSSEGKDNREQEISEISRSLKALAKELSVPVVALSQLNRQVENRTPPVPRLAAARSVPEPQDPVVWPDGHVVLLGHLIGDGSYLEHQPLRYTTSSEENSAAVADAARGCFESVVRRYAGRGAWHQLLLSGNGNRWRPAGVNAWLRSLGIFGQRSGEKRIPVEAFRLSNRQVGLLLQHLW